MKLTLSVAEYGQTDTGIAPGSRLDETAGEYIWFRGSSVTGSETLAEKTLASAEKTGAEIVTFRVRYASDAGSETICTPFRRNVSGEYAFSVSDLGGDVGNAVTPLCANMIVSRALLQRMGIVSLPEEEQTVPVLLMAAVLCSERLAYLPEVLATMSDAALPAGFPDELIRFGDEMAELFAASPEKEKLTSAYRGFVAGQAVSALRAAGDVYSAAYCSARKKTERFLAECPLFAGLCEADFADKRLYRQTAELRDRFLTRQTIKGGPRPEREVIVSLTSYPQRISTVHVVISTLMEQSREPDRIQLYLAAEQFPAGEAELPPQLLAYKELGLEILWCGEDLRPHKKYYYAMRNFPSAVIITADDDICYGFDMVDCLVRSYLQYPNAVSALRVHLVGLNEDGGIAPYDQWSMEYSRCVGRPAFRLFPTGCSGVLYPPHCMDEGVFDTARIREACLNADDIWLKLHEMRAGTPVVLAKANEPLQYVNDSQWDALTIDNVSHNRNDEQLRDALRVLGMEERELVERFETDFEPEITVMQRWKQSSREKDERIEGLKRELNDIRSSPSYRLGRAVTWLPRAAVKAVRRLQEKGLADTWKRVMVKLHLRKES